MTVVPTVSFEYLAVMGDGTRRTITVRGLHLNSDEELAAVCEFENGSRASIPVRLLEELE